MKAHDIVVQCLEAQGVEVIFGIPGAKIDAVFNALKDSSIRLIVCRHEQNAAFMAACYGRLTGRPGVVLVTSGPGVANLTTGLLTATTEGDPIVAIGGNVGRDMHLKESHQNTDNVNLMKVVTKYSVEATCANNIAEVIDNAFRQATLLRNGACFISLPQDVLNESTNPPCDKLFPNPHYGAAPKEAIQRAADQINHAKLPVILLGAEASRPDNAKTIRSLLEKFPLPVVSTFQAAGVISRKLQHCFVGRVGLFKNQPGDQLLDQSDVVITIGYNPVEYDPEVWNAKSTKHIIHIDNNPAAIHLDYYPETELVGDITQTLSELKNHLKTCQHLNKIEKVKSLHDDLYRFIESGKTLNGERIHPLRFIYELRQFMKDEDIITCDVGSVYMWMARYFLCYEPHHLLFSNGQQTLGIALPWAMAANLVFPNKRIFSLSGDGGFLFSAMELETAVREKLNFVHFVWSDGSYNMVEEQEIMKYQRKSGVDLGHVKLPEFAEAFGATGFSASSADELPDLFEEAVRIKGPVLIDIPIDYSDNPGLFEASGEVGN